METTTVTEAKARLSELLRRVEEGESILILSRGRPVARLEPVNPAAAGSDARLRRLEERGLLRRGTGLDPSTLDLDEEDELPPGCSLLAVLLEEREEGR